VIYFGSAKGSYKEAKVFDLNSDLSYSISVADLDFDGDIDIVVGNVEGVNNIFINSKNGQKWLKKSLTNKNFFTYDILVNDLNGDDKPDIIESNSDEHNIYYFNKTN
jgi:hypothetical protein